MRNLFLLSPSCFPGSFSDCFCSVFIIHNIVYNKTGGFSSGKIHKKAAFLIRKAAFFFPARSAPIPRGLHCRALCHPFFKFRIASSTSSLLSSSRGLISLCLSSSSFGIYLRKIAVKKKELTKAISGMPKRIKSMDTWGR